MRVSPILVVLALVAGVHASGGCATSSGDGPPPAAVPYEAARAEPDLEASRQRSRTVQTGAAKTDGTCPMAIEGTTARVEDTEGGAAIVFTTRGDVSELRRRVAHMAQMHARRPAAPDVVDPDMALMTVPPSIARSEDIEGGARLVVTPRDMSDIPAVRGHVRAHAEMMATGECPMEMGAEQTPAQ